MIAAIATLPSIEAVDAQCDSWKYAVTVGSQEEVLSAARRIRTYNKLHLDPKAAAARGLPDIVVPAVMIGGYVDEAVTSELGEVFAGEVNLKFRKPIHPGDALEISCAVVARSRRIIRVEVEILKNSQIAAKGKCVVFPA